MITGQHLRLMSLVVMNFIQSSGTFLPSHVQQQGPRNGVDRELDHGFAKRLEAKELWVHARD